MLMKRDEGGELRPPQWELEDGSSLGELSASLTEGTMTRAQTLKLGGAALLAGTGMMLLFQSPADARKRHKKHRRRRRKAQVSPDPVPIVPAGTVLNITNPSDRPLTISGAQLLGSNGSLVTATDLNPPVTIEPHATVPVTFTFDPTAPLVDAGQLRLLDASGTPITVENGNTQGNVDVTVP
jgi:hypothetical protein